MFRPRRAAVGVLLAVVLVGACGGASAEPLVGEGGVQRLRFRLAPGAAPEGQERVVQAFDLVEEAGFWEIDAPQQAVRGLDAMGDVEGGGSRGQASEGSAGGQQGAPSLEDEPQLVVGSKAARKTIHLKRTGRFDPAEFDAVQLLVTFAGQGSLVADFARDGVVLGSSDPVMPRGDGRPQPAVLPVPERLRDAAPFDQLVLRFLGDLGSQDDLRRLALRHVELVRWPVARRLPSPGAPRQVRRGGEARACVGLVAGRDLITATQVPEGARLRLGLVQPAPLQRRGTAPVVEVHLKHAGSGRTETLRAPLPPFRERGRWSEVDWPLAGWEGRVTATVRLVDDLARDGRQAQPGPLACLVAEASVVAPTAAPRTVLLVTSASHRADHTGYAFRGVDIELPALDALAARGTAYTDCFVTSNLAVPALGALMTGEHPIDLGLLDAAVRLGQAEETLAERFADAGFATLAVAGSRNAWDQVSGLGQGFDRMLAPTLDLRRPSSEVVADVREALPDMAGLDLFVWVQLADGDWPHEPSPEHLALHYDPKDDPADPAIKAPKVPARFLPLPYEGVRDLRYPGARYKGALSTMDEALGELLALPRLGSAWVAFVGERGLAQGEHGTWFKALGCYPGVLAVPLVLAGPEVPEGLRVDAPVSHRDVARTLLALAGVPHGRMPGRGLLPPPEAVLPRVAVESNGMSASLNLAPLHLVVNLQKRALAHIPENRRAHEFEIYDLTRDWGGEHDLRTDPEYTDDIRRLWFRLVDRLSAQPESTSAEKVVTDPALVDRWVDQGFVGPHPGLPERLWNDDRCEYCRLFGR